MIHSLARICICLLLICAYTSAQAQSGWSVGLRTGLELSNLFKVHPNLDYRDNMIWTNEAFITKKLSRRIEADAALRFNTKGDSDSTTMSGSDYRSSDISRVSQVSLQLTLRYHVIVRPRYSLYGQLGTSVDYRTEKTEGWHKGAFTETMFYTSHYRYMQYFERIHLGVGMNYLLTSRIYATATIMAGFKTTPSFARMDVMGYSSWSGNILCGMGYRF